MNVHSEIVIMSSFKAGLDGDAQEQKFDVKSFPGRHFVRKKKLLGGVITNFKLAA